MRIDVWSDLVCPWCYLGQRRLQHALDGALVEVVHRAFQLDPSMPRGEVFDQHEVLRAKYGLSEAQATTMQSRMEKLAAGEDLEYHLAGGHTGNTFEAHQVLHLARERGLQARALERLYRAHFTERRSLFDRASLADLAAEAGLERSEVMQALADDRYADAVNADLAEAVSLGVTGVPFFVIDGRYGISGAQPVELFAKAIGRARAEARA